MSLLISDEYNRTLDKIEEILTEKDNILDEMEQLKTNLDQLELNEYLLTLKLDSPLIICSTDDKIKKYKYISKPVHILDLGLSLYPLWIQMECTYPEWSNDFMSINLINYKDYQTGTGFECLIDSITEGLNCSYRFAQNLILDENLTIPITFIYKCVLGSNLLIDYNNGLKISNYECDKHKYHITCTTDENMVSNTVKIKYVLMIPFNYSNQIDFV